MSFVSCALWMALLGAAPLHAASGGASCPGQVLYVSTDSGRLYRVDDYWSNPFTVFLGDTGLPNLSDIAVDPTTSEILGIGFTTRDLYRIDPQSLQVSVIGNTGITLNALEVSPTGIIYSRGMDQLLYELDPFTAAPIVVGDTGSMSAGDLAMEPSGMLLGSTIGNEIDRIDPQTGNAIILGSPSLTTIWGLEMDCNGTLYALTMDGDLYVIDLNTMGSIHLGNIGIPDDVWGMAFSVETEVGDVGTNYCGPANFNSSGQSAVISGTGSEIAALNQLELHAAQLPTDQFGYFLNSETQSFKPFTGGSQGNLCLGGTIGRHVKQIQNSGFTGEFSIQVDLSGLPTPSGPHRVLAGETWNFQAWFRDANPGPTSNFTNGLSIQFL